MEAATATKAIGHLEPIANLIPSPLNPRKRFTEADLADLQASVSKLHRVLDPLLVRPSKKHADKYEIVDGERRWHCATRAQVTDVPVVVESLSDHEALEIMLMSAVLSQALTPLEEAEAFKQQITLGKGAHTLQSIGQKIGKDAKWVANRIRLTDLIPDAKEALQVGAMRVGHGEILARLKPADQKKVFAFPTGFYNKSGLWERRHATIDFEDAGPKTKFDKFRPVSERELESYVATHIRFDAEHMAATAPLEFGATAEAIAAAEARQKRGKKIVPISFERQLTMDARDKDGERTYCKDSWRKIGAKTCDKAVLGVVAAGAHYGRSFDVCVNKDCAVHWPKEATQRAKRKKAADSRATGKPATKAESQASIQKREAEEASLALEAMRDEEREAVVLGVEATAIAAVATKAKELTDDLLLWAIVSVMPAVDNAAYETVKATAKAMGLTERIFSYESDSKALAKMTRVELMRVLAAASLLALTDDNRGMTFGKDFVDTCKANGVDVQKLAKEALAPLEKKFSDEDAAAKAQTPTAPKAAAKKAKKR